MHRKRGRNLARSRRRSSYFYFPSPVIKPIAKEESMRELLTVVESVYHSQEGRQPTAITSKFTRELTTSEQAYVRYQVVTEEWQEIDLAWIGENLSSLCIANEEGTVIQTYPTEEAKAELARKVLEVRFVGDAGLLLIPPRESTRILPKLDNGDKLEMRSEYGKINCRVAAFPS